MLHEMTKKLGMILYFFCLSECFAESIHVHFFINIDSGFQYLNGYFENMSFT
jgi:hypothetical protein